MRDTILVIANASDGSVDSVLNLLNERGEKFFRLATDDFPKKVCIKLGFVEGAVTGSIEQCGKIPLDVGRIKSCWYRTTRRSEGFNHLPHAFTRFIQEESKATLWSLYTNLDIFWMNHPLISSRLLEGNKLYQINLAAKSGLSVPNTLITNRPEALLEFCKKHNGIIAVKMMSPHIFVSSDRTETYYIYTQQITEKQLMENYASITIAPIFAQEYIQKDIELRITIVNDRIFACAIDSQSSERTRHDWRRYDFDRVAHEAFQLPSEIQQKLIAFMGSLGVTFGAIDMILTPTGEYVFLEVNPHGQWDWIEKLAKLPISQAIADTLARPPIR